VEGETLGGKMVGTGSHDGGLVSWDHGAVGVGHQVRDTSQGTGIADTVASCWDSRGNGTNGAGARCNGGVESGTLGGKVVGTGSHHCGLVSRDNSTIGVTNQVWDTSQGTGIAKSWGSMSDGSRSHWARSRCNGSVESSSLGSKVVSPGGGNGRLVIRGDGTVGVDPQAKGGSAESLGTSIANVTSMSNGGTSKGSWDGSMESSSLGSQVVGPGGNNSWLISRDDGTIWVGHQLGNVDRSWVAGQNAGADNGSRAKGSQQLHVRY